MICGAEITWFVVERSHDLWCRDHLISDAETMYIVE